MKVKVWNRISFSQGRNAFIVGLILGIIGGFIQIASEFFRQEELITANIRQMVQMVQDSAASAAYNVNEVQAEKAISGLANYWPVSRVEIIDDFGTMLSSRGAGGEQPGGGTFTRLFGLPHKDHSFPLYYYDKSIPVGKIKVYLDRNVIIGRFVKGSTYVIFDGIITALVMATVLALIFYYSLTRPLLRVVGDIAEVDVANPQDFYLRDPMFHRHDEMGLLVKTINRLLEQIKLQNDVLKDTNVELEKRVQDRTRALKDAEEKLIRTEKLAVIGKLAGSIAHELRTPLGVLKNAVYFLNMKLKGSGDEKVNKHLRIMEDEIHVSDRIISDILTFGRVKEPEREETDINQVILQALSKVDIPENIKVTTQLDNDLPRLHIDNIQVEQVFSNLLLNAIQSMESGGEMVIRTHMAGGSVEGQVIDTGVGIPEENIPKIFEPLFSTKVTGTGLGLSICKNIVDMHKGQIHVYSRVGEGTSVTVKLPIKV